MLVKISLSLIKLRKKMFKNGLIYKSWKNKLSYKQDYVGTI